MTDVSAKNDLLEYVIALADDALTLGHRLSEWSSHAPLLEEDLALSNVALDFIGRARMWYQYAAELANDGRTEDDFAYLRDCRDFRNLLIHELPRGDFAVTIARQYAVDQFNVLYLTALEHSADKTLAAIAAKAIKESRYHLRRSRDWMIRLGDGTEESHRRLQTALEQLWGYFPEMFQMEALELRLLDQGIAVDRRALRETWDTLFDDTLAEATLSRPQSEWQVAGGRAGNHTEHLGFLLAEMQFLQRAYPGLEW